MAITSGCQSDDTGSIPVTRSLQWGHILHFDIFAFSIYDFECKNVKMQDVTPYVFEGVSHATQRSKKTAVCQATHASSDGGAACKISQKGTIAEARDHGNRSDLHCSVS